ncbi:UDP-N-acetylmuramoyl-L-alanyl-D-glutamate--2,6-diaminopimelate ligase [Desulfonatronospira sp.]|uniref:UDP-N-acetylmuramoyl-L-alanyl-D-glutamate--2, 6-diaminopimelate ligase n=1 Tax=Desulfonatronospira sp. TaxID=1962951 RepID=UPI0025C57E92|nr:UDP-N-acetylmuramoyl-L-alanyl-D-glutamate--2,6-diaminopimelate ligase [Desulfonatronospira sp.]
MSSWNKVLNEARLGRQVQNNSRLVSPGDIFVAVPGTRVHGNAFIPEALDRGAAFVVADSEYPGMDRVIIHSRPAIALGALARAYFGTGNLDMKVVGITGTNGKTTTSYILEYLFTCSGYRVGVLGTVNYRWPGTLLKAGTTTPDCLKLHRMLADMQRQGVQVVFLEASSHALDQKRLAGIDVHVGVFTNLSRDHLDYHKDMQDYFQAKKKLFEPTDSGKFLGSIINLDDPYGRILALEAPSVIGYGLQNTFPPLLQGRLVHSSARGIELKCRFRDTSWSISCSLPGTHNAQNLLAAQGVGLCLGLGPGDFQCLKNLGSIPGRLEKVHSPGEINIFVDYAHTPDALENVCLALKGLPFAKLAVLFGCGGDRDRGKRQAMGRAVASHADVVFLTSDNPRFEDPENIIQDILPGLNGHPCVNVEPDRRLAIVRAVSGLGPGEALLVAGKGHEDYQEVRGVRHAFSDAEEIQKALQYLHNHTHEPFGTEAGYT